MAKLSVKQIQDRAREHLEKASSKGLRYIDLFRKIHQADPETPENTIMGSLQTLKAKGDEIIIPSRGLWILRKFAEPATDPISNPSVNETFASTELRESAFYKPFADWLVGQDEVIEAMVVGGNSFKSKWATPDVIGTYRPRTRDPVKFQLELVSAEIKTNAYESITAFGQACAYRLFSHKTYIVMPSDIGDTDLDRLDALCSLYGMGLVLFDRNPDGPNFQTKLKAQRLEPDKFYLNDFARRIQEVDPKHFDRLFG